MSERPDLAAEAAEGVRSVFSRLGEFFHIFDLSFLVSGATTLGALLFLSGRLNLSIALPDSSWIVGFALIIASYVCGLVSFAVGRSLNGRLFRQSALSHFKQAIEGQGLKGNIVTSFLQGEKQDGYPLWRLYIRLWQQLAEKHPNSVAFHHLSRYWAMAATYDGVAFSLLAWAVALTPIALLGTNPLSPTLALASMILLILAAIACLRQGAKYYEFQVEDLVAALAVAKSPVD